MLFARSDSICDSRCCRCRRDRRAKYSRIRWRWTVRRGGIVRVAATALVVGCIWRRWSAGGRRSQHIWVKCRWKIAWSRAGPWSFHARGVPCGMKNVEIRMKTRSVALVEKEKELSKLKFLKLCIDRPSWREWNILRKRDIFDEELCWRKECAI